MDVFSFITAEHHRIADLMEEVVDTSDKVLRGAIFRQIKAEFALHDEVMERIFYPAILTAARGSDVQGINRAEHQHDEIRTLLKTIDETSMSSDLWIERFGELKNAMSYHIKGEEAGIFAAARKYLPASDYVTLSEEMARIKDEARAKAQTVNA